MNGKLTDTNEFNRTPEDRFDDYLQSRGMRNTQQRRILLKKVFAQAEYFDADQLIELLPSKGHSDHVSRPTVYRTLSEFVDAGLLRKFDLDGRMVYGNDTGSTQADHFYCCECRKLIEFVRPALLEFTKKVADEYHFQIRSHRLIIRGFCQECRSQKRRKKRRVDLI